MARFGLSEMPVLSQGPNDDVRPTNNVPIIYLDANGRTRCSYARWGLVPADSPTEKPAKAWFNARGETLHFIEPWAKVWKADQRCLVPVSSFFEWPVLAAKKTKIRISMRDGSPFAFAGLYSRWKRSGEPREDLISFTIITCKPSSEMAVYHDRMPVILAPGDYNRFLEADHKEAKALLRPYPDGTLKFEPV